MRPASALWGGDYESFVRRVDAAGAELWTHHFRPDSDPSVWLFDAAATADGVVVVGGGTDAFIRKYDAAGRVLWTRQFGTPGEDHANDVAVAPNGNIYVSGYLGGGFLQAADAFVRQYDGLGNEGWTQQFGEPGSSNSARGLAVAPDETIFAMSVARMFGPFRQERAILFRLRSVWRPASFPPDEPGGNQRRRQCRQRLRGRSVALLRLLPCRLAVER